MWREGVWRDLAERTRKWTAAAGPCQYAYTAVLQGISPEWVWILWMNRSLSILLGLLIGKHCPGRSPSLCRATTQTHFANESVPPIWWSPRCAEQEAKHISMESLCHHLGASVDRASQPWLWDKEPVLLGAHTPGPCTPCLWLMLGQRATVCRGGGTVWQVDGWNQQEICQISVRRDCGHRSATCVFSAIRHSLCNSFGKQQPPPQHLLMIALHLNH